jgi:hypothetical protein
VVKNKSPLQALARELEAQLRATEARGDQANGRKRKGWKKEITRAFEEATGGLKGTTDREILDEIKLYRAQRRKSPEINVIAVPQEKTA